MITVIVARARNGAIGKANTIPWHAPEDLAAFKQETLGGAVIMGRRTWDSLPRKPLPNRLNIVVSASLPDGPDLCRSVEEALRHARAQGVSRIYAIGGAAIYAEMLPLAHRLLITEVDIAVEGADTFFPEFAAQDWLEIGTRPLRTEAPRCLLREFLRRDPQALMPR